MIDTSGTMSHMSNMMHEHNVPVLTLGWRLKMSLGDMAAHDMADALGVSRATISRWMADWGAPPRAIYIKQWALITKTDPGWLLTGQPPAPFEAPGGAKVTLGYKDRNLVLVLDAA